MGLFDIFKFGNKSTEDSVEFPEDQEPRERLTVRIENIGGLGDVERVGNYLKQGNVVLVKVKDLQRTVNELALIVTSPIFVLKMRPSTPMKSPISNFLAAKAYVSSPKLSCCK